MEQLCYHPQKGFTKTREDLILGMNIGVKVHALDHFEISYSDGKGGLITEAIIGNPDHIREFAGAKAKVGRPVSYVTFFVNIIVQPPGASSFIPPNRFGVRRLDLPGLKALSYDWIRAAAKDAGTEIDAYIRENQVVFLDQRPETFRAVDQPQTRPKIRWI